VVEFAAQRGQDQQARFGVVLRRGKESGLSLIPIGRMSVDLSSQGRERYLRRGTGRMTG
jgi:hypothetical protein